MSHSDKLTYGRMLFGAPTVLIILNRAVDQEGIQALALYFFSFFFLLAWEITDILDGRLARKRGETSNLGKVSDPLADVMLHLPIYLFMVMVSWVPWWMFMINMMREVFITGARTIVATIGNGEAVGSKLPGKIKTWGYAISQLWLILYHGLLSSGIEIPYGLEISWWLLFTTTALCLYTWITYGHFFVYKIQGYNRKFPT